MDVIFDGKFSKFYGHNQIFLDSLVFTKVNP